MPKKNELQRQVMDAIAAAEAKKAEDVSVLELDKASGGFTDFFVICSASNPRQVQAISDEVEQRLSRDGLRPTHVEGYKQAEWVLLDYVDFVVHVFSQKARNFYNLERLWKSAKQWTPGELRSQPRKRGRPTSKPTASRAHRSRPRAQKA
jgi:ribosome-associated protein